MRGFFGLLSCLISVLLVSSCATTMQIALPQKYNLGDKLEEVTEIRDMKLGDGRAPRFNDFIETFEPAADVIARRDTFTLSETKNHWIKVDMQSLILRNGPNDYYLMVLQRPAYNLMTVDTVSFVNLLNIIRAKRDNIKIGEHSYTIERLYKIVGNDKMLAIKNLLAG